MGLTKEQAIALHESEFWKDLSYIERAKFQLFEPLLCMPFDVFHEAVEKALCRPVWTHEFGSKGHLEKEFLGEKPPPTMEEIIDLIPESKRIVCSIEDQDKTQKRG